MRIARAASSTVHIVKSLSTDRDSQATATACCGKALDWRDVRHMSETRGVVDCKACLKSPVCANCGHDYAIVFTRKTNGNGERVCEECFIRYG